MNVTATEIKRPLCVDLDGSLLATDMLWESLLELLKTKPVYFLYLPFWLLKGKAYFKRQIAKQVHLDPGCLPYRKSVLSFLQKQKASGREIILATASDEIVANKIAQHLGFFSSIIASNGEKNLSGTQKLKALENHLGSRNFDYVGNDIVDLPVWQATDNAIMVNPSAKLIEEARQISSSQTVLTEPEDKFLTLIMALRIYQWVKNLLIFIPLLQAHKITDLHLWLKGIYAFCAFSLCASSVYIVNDLMDLESDRQHPKKKYRPFAAGKLQIKTGVFLAPFLLVASFLISILLLPTLFSAVLCLYLVLTTVYSFYLKRLPIIDVLSLAGLYTFRILAGGVALAVPISIWLLAFSMFFFLSLAFIKRCSEPVMSG